MSSELAAPHAALAGLSLDHVAVATYDLAQASAAYVALGLLPEGPDEEVPSQGVRVRAYQVGSSLIELLCPTTSTSPVAAFLSKRGAGLHHLAFRVQDLHVEMQRLEALGAPLLLAQPSAGRAGTLVAFVHPKWSGGTLIELVQHPSTAEGRGH